MELSVCCPFFSSSGWLSSLSLSLSLYIDIVKGDFGTHSPMFLKFGMNVCSFIDFSIPLYIDVVIGDFGAHSYRKFFTTSTFLLPMSLAYTNICIAELIIVYHSHLQLLQSLILPFLWTGLVMLIFHYSGAFSTIQKLTKTSLKAAPSVVVKASEIPSLPALFLILNLGSWWGNFIIVLERGKSIFSVFCILRNMDRQRIHVFS